MSDPPKRSINANKILKDIQTGMDASEIKRKYMLTDKGYQSVFQKLSAMGLLKESDHHFGMSTPKQQHERPERQVPIVWRCPACGTPQTRAYAECPHCGIIVAKISATNIQRYPHPQSYSYETHGTDSGLSNRWPVFIVSIIAFLVVGGAIIKWSSYQGARASIGTSASVAGSVHSFTKTNFEQEVNEQSKNMPVLIMFYADS